MNVALSDTEFETVYCDLCAYNTPTRLWKWQDGFNIVRCERCGLLFLNPRPAPTSIQQYYPIGYYAHRDSKGIWATLNRAKYRILKAIAVYELGYPQQADVASRKIETVERVLAYLLRRRFSRIPPFGSQNPRRSLDIGCGTGAYVLLLQQLGWDAWGVEPDPQAVLCARAKGCRNVVAGTLEDVDFEDASFDLVTIWDVLEHTHSPRALLQNARRILRPDGLLMLKVPNADCLEARLWGNHWMGWDIPRHLYHFTPQTLMGLLDIAGFRVRELDYVSPPNVVASGLIFGVGHRWPQLSSLSLLYAPLTFLFWPVAQLLDVAKVGNTIQVLAELDGKTE